VEAFVLVFFGGGLGAAIRHAVNLSFGKLFGGFPFATLFENVSGSFLMGLLAGYFAFKSGASQHIRLFLTTGILGGYTTFSTFSLDAALLWERDHYSRAALYVALSILGTLGGIALGLALMRR
jgi:CrcB protein